MANDDVTVEHRDDCSLCGRTDKHQHGQAKYLRDKVAPKQDDPDERAEVLARADQVEAQAGGWPLRLIGGGA